MIGLEPGFAGIAVPSVLEVDFYLDSMLAL